MNPLERCQVQVDKQAVPPRLGVVSSFELPEKGTSFAFLDGTWEHIDKPRDLMIGMLKAYISKVVG